MPVVISLEYLDANRSERGAFTLAQMKVLGVRWPQPSGWRQALVGTVLSDQKAAEFQNARHILTAKTKRRHNEQEANLLRAKGKEVPAHLLPPEPPAASWPMSKSDRKRIAKQERVKLKKAAKAKALAIKLEKAKLKAPIAPKMVPVSKVYKGDVNAPDFLNSFEWRKLRMEVLKAYGPACMCCGATPASGAVINVDHIKPRRSYPALALDFNNLQVLCNPCNHGKGSWDETDWRPDELAVSPEVRDFIRGIANDRA